MNSPHTAKDALIAELLGDMDHLLTRFEQAQKSMEQLHAVIERSHDDRVGRAARDLEVATSNFGDVTTRSVDDFVNMANEALSKFMLRTDEIKVLLDKPVLLAPVASSPMPTPVLAQHPKKKPSSMALGWLFPAIFAAGVVVRVVLD